MKYIALKEFETDAPIGKKAKGETFLLTDEELKGMPKGKIDDLVKLEFIDEADKKVSSKK